MSSYLRKFYNLRAWRRRFLNFNNVLPLFRNYLPLEKDRALYLNLNPHHTRRHCAKFGWNWPCGSGEEDFLNFVNVFLLFCNYLPLEIGLSPSFEQTWIPFTQGVWLKFAQWFWRTRFLNFINVLLSALGKGCGPSFD